jgi:hypothetical protein
MVGSKDSGRMRFLHNSKSLNSLVFILYLIPGLPKDLFTYVVPLTAMRPSAFFVLSTIARAPAIFASTFVAAAFKAGDFVGMAIVAVIFGGLGVLGIVFNQKIMAFIDGFLTRRHGKTTQEEPDVGEKDVAAAPVAAPTATAAPARGVAAAPVAVPAPADGGQDDREDAPDDDAHNRDED